MLILWANGLVNGDIWQEHLLTGLLNGAIIGCLVAAVPSLELRKKVRVYYKRKREEVRADFEIGR